MLVLGAVIDEQEYSCARNAVDEIVEECLGLRIDPVQILKNQGQRPYLALPEQQTFARIEGPLPALRRIQALPLDVIRRNMQKLEERRDIRQLCLVEGHELSAYLLAYGPRFIPGLDPKIVLEKTDYGKERAGHAIGERARFQHEPALHSMRARELEKQARFSHRRLADHAHHLAVAAPRLLQCVP